MRIKVAAVATALCGCAGSGGIAGQTGTITPHLAVASFNAAGGYDAAHRTAAVRAQQREYLTGLGLDILGIQEVVGDPADIAPAGWTCVFAYEGKLDDGSPTGNALCVRPGLRIAAWEVIPLDYGDRANGTDEWQRASVTARVVGGGVNVAVANAHLAAGDSAASNALRKRQIDETVAGNPDVVVGDMNAYGEEMAPELAPLKLLTARKDDNRSGCTDQVWARGGSGALVLVNSGEDRSDHPFAAVAEIE